MKSAIVDRITYALLGSLFGSLIGVACWWLYGRAHSLNYPGPGIDPVLRHWVTCVGGVFMVIGFLFRQRVSEVIGDTINAIFHFEGNQSPDERHSPIIAYSIHCNYFRSHLVYCASVTLQFESASNKPSLTPLTKYPLQYTS